MSTTSDAADYAVVQKRVADDVCAACRKPIKRGHRVMAAYICLDPQARNPENITSRALQLGMDCEFVHVRCKDPYLNGRRLT